MTKNIDTVVEDVYALFDKEHKVNEDNLRSFADNIAAILKKRLEEHRVYEEPKLRMSQIGVPNRKLYFSMNTPESVYPKEALRVDGSTSIKFIFGDLIEELVLFLVKEAGHSVEGEQGEVEIEGVLGHRDCKIDGITSDIKSASKFAFKKFQEGTLLNDDPFGYIGQISGYSYADDSPFGAFLAMNKESGALALMKVDKIDMIHPPTRIQEINTVLQQPNPPEEKCYPDIPWGKGGNKVLAMGCHFCAFKHLCWKDANNGQGLRQFQYADGVKHFTQVLDTPRVKEILEDS